MKKSLKKNQAKKITSTVANIMKPLQKIVKNLKSKKSHDEVEFRQAYGE